MLKAPDDGARLELGRFVRPDSVPGSPAAMANELGLRNVAFEVNDLQAAVDWAATEGYGLVGGSGEYEGVWRMAYVRGPEGITASLAERIADPGAFVATTEYMRGGIAYFRGEVVLARTHFEQVLAHYHPREHGSIAVRYGMYAEPALACGCWRAESLLLLGHGRGAGESFPQGARRLQGQLWADLEGWALEAAAETDDPQELRGLFHISAASRVSAQNPST